MPAAKPKRSTSLKRAPTSAPRSSAKPGVKRGAASMSLQETMRALEKAGTAQARKTYLRHGASEPLFGVSFAVLKTLVKKIGVDHALALELWETKNHDARTLALKIADPTRVKPGELDRWAQHGALRFCGSYVAMLAAESAHGDVKVREWLGSSKPTLRALGWRLVGCLANLDEERSDEWFGERVADIERSIHEVSNAEREAMNTALITIGGRNAALRRVATTAAKRIGKVEVDHGDTECKTPDAVPYLEKMWAHATSKKFPSPAAQERARESMRTRC